VGSQLAQVLYRNDLQSVNQRRLRSIHGGAEEAADGALVGQGGNGQDAADVLGQFPV
jgi:hypothetical protein